MGAAVGKDGTLDVIRDLGMREPYIGQVPLTSGEIAEDVTTYFAISEQIPTVCALGVLVDKDLSVRCAGGFIIQLLPDATDEMIEKLEKKLDSLNEDDILILAGSIPASLSQDTYERLLARLQGRGVRAVVDATRDLLVNVLQYHPFLIKPNNHELGEIVGRVLTMDEEIIAAARTLQQKGARNVLVSMAGDGALLVDENGEVHRIGCPKGKVVNSVGAGDSMVAGFVAGWMQTRSYSFALRLGTACGSATAFSLGLATKEKIDELMKEI